MKELKDISNKKVKLTTTAGFVLMNVVVNLNIDFKINFVVNRR